MNFLAILPRATTKLFFSIGVAKIIKKVCVSPQSVAVAQIGHARHSVGFFSVFFCEDHTEFYFQFIP